MLAILSAQKSEWGRVPERDMLSLGVMGMGAGDLGKFFRRRRRRRRRPPPKVGFLVITKSSVLWHIAELWIFWRRHMKATGEAVLFYFNKIAEKKVNFSKKNLPHARLRPTYGGRPKACAIFLCPGQRAFFLPGPKGPWALGPGPWPLVVYYYINTPLFYIIILFYRLFYIFIYYFIYFIYYLIYFIYFIICYIVLA